MEIDTQGAQNKIQGRSRSGQLSKEKNHWVTEGIYNKYYCIYIYKHAIYIHIHIQGLYFLGIHGL